VALRPEGAHRGSHATTAANVADTDQTSEYD
jgi:hypothetical protein